MSLNAADVAEIMKLIEQSSFNEINLEVGELKIHLRRGASSAVASTQIVATPIAPVTAQPKTIASVQQDPNIHEVASPLLGTFYRSPKPGAAAFVEVGTEVEADTVVAIVEVMKLMNTVRAGVRGTVTEILIADGALAEYGETLVRIRKAQ